MPFPMAISACSSFCATSAMSDDRTLYPSSASSLSMSSSSAPAPTPMIAFPFSSCSAASAASPYQSPPPRRLSWCSRFILAGCRRHDELLVKKSEVFGNQLAQNLEEIRWNRLIKRITNVLLEQEQKQRGDGAWSLDQSEVTAWAGGPGAALAHEGEARLSRSQSCSSGPPSASASTSATITGARVLLRRRYLPRRDSPLRRVVLWDDVT